MTAAGPEDEGAAERDAPGEPERTPGRERQTSPGPEQEHVPEVGAPDDASDDPPGPVEGVESLDHTADVGIRVRAWDLETLYRRAALGALWIALGAPAAPGDEARTLRVFGADHPDLLRRWLQEILFLQEVEGFATGAVEALHLERGPDGLHLEAQLRGGPAPRHPAREIKGVTWHGLRVEEGTGEDAGGWLAQVIFDV